MTNGEKFQQIFAVSQVDECDLNVYAWLPSHDAIEIPVEWWNANYSEIPTGSTDCISRQAVIDLMMQKWGENFSGDDAMQESIDAIRVMPSVTPQEPFINKPCVSSGVCEHDKQNVLDKIRAEIEEPLKINQGLNTESAKAQAIALSWVLEVIDKYKAESGG